MMAQLKNMLPFLVLMVLAGLIVQAVVKGNFAAILLIMAVIAAICAVVLVLYAMERLPGRYMLRLDKLLGRERRIKESKRSKLVDFSADRAREIFDREVVCHDKIGHAILAQAITRSADNGRQGPLASALLIGPRGQGITTLCRKIACAFYGSEADMITVDAKDYDNPSALFLDASGLLDVVRRDHEIVLHIENVDHVFRDDASHTTQKAMNALLEYGDVGGQQMVLRNAIVILSSHLGGADAAAKPDTVKDIARAQGMERLSDAVSAVHAVEFLTSKNLATVALYTASQAASDFAVKAEKISPAAAVQFSKIYKESAQKGGSIAALRDIKRALEGGLAKLRQGGISSATIDYNNDTGFSVTPFSNKEEA